MTMTTNILTENKLYNLERLGIDTNDIQKQVYQDTIKDYNLKIRTFRAENKDIDNNILFRVIGYLNKLTFKSQVQHYHSWLIQQSKKKRIKESDLEQKLKAIRVTQFYLENNLKIYKSFKKEM